MADYFQLNPKVHMHGFLLYIKSFLKLFKKIRTTNLGRLPMQRRFVKSEAWHRNQWWHAGSTNSRNSQTKTASKDQQRTRTKGISLFPAGNNPSKGAAAKQQTLCTGLTNLFSKSHFFLLLLQLPPGRQQMLSQLIVTRLQVGL